MTNTGWPGTILARLRTGAVRTSAQSSDTALASPMSMRGPDRATSRANAPQPWPDGTALIADMAERRELAVAPRAPTKRPEPAARDVLEEHPLDGILRAEAEDLLALGLDELLGHAREL